jgi:GNAT superfamily N-acetyltransferase
MQRDELQKVVLLAMQDKSLMSGEHSVVTLIDKRVAVLRDALVVGFYTPRQQTYVGQKYWRAGALYLDPAFRGQGIMRTALAQFFDVDVPGLAWIEESNASSVKLFTSMGFKTTTQKSLPDGSVGHWYVLKKKPPIYRKWTP